MMSELGRWLLFTVFGILLQALGIGLFSAVSRTNWSSFGQPIVLLGMGLSLFILLWRTLKKRRKARAIVVAGVCLAVGYVLAFHIVGAIAFPGLLRDLHSNGYVGSVFRVFIIAAVLHSVFAATLFTILNVIAARLHSRVY
jgi:hypothetical protein